MAYIGRENDGFGVRSRFIYTATGGQTTFNTDDSGNALSYSDGAYVDVYLNGVLLDPADYTATSLTSIVLDSGATASDILEVIVYDVFSVFSGTFTNGITTSDATVTGDLTISDKIVHSGDTNTNVRFPAADTVSVETAGSERMRVASDGTVMIAQTSDKSGVAGHIFTPEGAGFHIRDGGLPFVINRLTDVGALAAFRKDGTTVGSLGIDSGGFYVDGEANHSGLRFKGGGVTPRLNAAQADGTVSLGNATERFNNLYLGGGAYIGGTGDANLLDDYEEGTWTPTIGAGTITAANALYIRIGRFIQVSAVISAFSDRTTVTNLNVGGLPFTSASTNKTNQSIMCRYINAGGDSIAAYIRTSVTEINFYGINQGSGYARVTHDDLNSSLSNLYITATYRCVA